MNQYENEDANESDAAQSNFDDEEEAYNPNQNYDNN
jgi:hypothetical protein